jgi:Cytochrome c7 and related cytochrome c
MPPHETGKQRAAKVPLDYYKRPDALEKWKLWLTAAAAAVTVGWLIVGLFRSDAGESRYSRGPVANVHAVWEDNCNACHAPFTPISGNAWSSGLVDDPHASNQLCSTCHQGPPHHKHLKGTREPDCASCHLEHRGREASLVSLPDSACTQCHGDLASHGGNGADGEHYENRILSFTKNDHPDFRSIKSDPGKLRFSHERHMTPGMVITKDGMPFRLQDIADKGDRDRYRRANAPDYSTVELGCASCHQLDSNDFPPNRDAVRNLPQTLLNNARGTGAYMLPITYENQCQACHPLTFDHKTLRHRMQPKEVHQVLEEFYADEVLKSNAALFKKPIPLRPLPGKKLLGDESEELEKLVNKKVLAAEQYFFQGESVCTRCHEYRPANGGFAVVNFSDLEIQPTNVPRVWFKHALFNHAAHRAVNCRSCHPGAFAIDVEGKPNPNASATHKDVLVPGVQNCLECHGPQTWNDGKLRGGARFNCTECHRYHGGDDPFHGFGAHPHDPERPRDINNFLLDRTPQ